MALTVPAPYANDMLGWFNFDQQPAQRDFGISTVADEHGRLLEYHREELATWPFCTLTEFSAAATPCNRILLVAPLSGHFAFILREMVVGLADEASVSVTNWRNVRFVPISAGDFGFEENIEAILQSIETLGPGVDVIALCQGVVPALAATAILAQRRPKLAPRSLILMGGPVDPLANPTRVVQLLRQRPLGWLEANALGGVDLSYPGASRHVYPAHHQFTALMAYFYRHFMSGGELFRKVFADDGLDPIRFPFLDLFISLMDLPAKYFLENIQKVFLDREIWTGRLKFRNEAVDFGAIRNTALMTIEGAQDDIAAPGQTSAAHRLCANVPDGMRQRLVIDGAGHFSLFHGRLWWEKILPEVRLFLAPQATE